MRKIKYIPSIYDKVEIIFDDNTNEDVCDFKGLFDRNIAEYIVKACNEYEALKEEKEKLKEELEKVHSQWHYKQAIELQQQRDELVEMLEKVLDTVNVKYDFERDVLHKAEQLRNKIKEGEQNAKRSNERGEENREKV